MQGEYPAVSQIVIGCDRHPQQCAQHVVPDTLLLFLPLVPSWLVQSATGQSAAQKYFFYPLSSLYTKNGIAAINTIKT